MGRNLDQQDGRENGNSAARTGRGFLAIYAPKNRPKDDSRTIQLTLVPERGRWRIYDIVYLSEPHSDPDEPKSLRQQIQKDIDFYAHQPKP